MLSWLEKTKLEPFVGVFFSSEQSPKFKLAMVNVSLLLGTNRSGTLVNRCIHVLVYTFIVARL